MIEKPLEQPLKVGAKEAVAANIQAVDIEQRLVICDLVDEAGESIARGRYYHLSDAPLLPLTPDDWVALGLVGSGLPSSGWSAKELRAWLILNGIEPPSRANKAELLELIKGEESAEKT